MADPLGPTYGVWLVALFLQTILYGMGLLQAYLYFFWYGKDHWMVKTTVATVVFLESLQMSALVISTYHYLIAGFGNSPALLEVYWASLVQLPATYISAFVVQGYFSWCIYALYPQGKILPLIIFVFALTSLGQVIVDTHLESYANIIISENTTILSCVFSVTSDTLITAGLTWRLHSSRTGIQATNNLLNYLIIFAINRGALTIVAALIQLIVFLVVPHTFYSFMMIWLAAKLYMNSMLATLNTRDHARKQQNDGTGDELYMGSLGSSQTRTTDAPRQVIVPTLGEDRERLGDGKFSL
ncbi:hypothetical protein DFH09DRAFT_1322640 [Mycena vulgaris]|nr:hypothetical protein DFH09DRAFT_1322640 [Mycena vulgaris]